MSVTFLGPAWELLEMGVGSLPYRPATGPEARHCLTPSQGPHGRQLLDGISAFQRACSPRCTFLSFLKASCDEGFLYTSLHSLRFRNT